MSAKDSTSQGWRKWWGDATSGALGGIIEAGAIWLGTLALGAVFPPVKAWLLRSVEMAVWGFLSIGLGAILLGFLAAVARMRSRNISATAEAPQALPNFDAPEPHFQPDDLQKRVLRMLRLADGDPISAEKIEEFVKCGSVQDVEEALEGLQRQHWAIRYLTHPVRYKLAGPGVAYARDEGFQTYAQVKEDERRGPRG
jgi:hypothetical protein